MLRSMIPRSHQRPWAKYHPLVPPMVRTVAQTLSALPSRTIWISLFSRAAATMFSAAVIGHPAAAGSPHEGLPVQGITGNDFQAFVAAPGPAPQPLRGPCHGTNPVAAGQQPRDEPAAHITGAAGNKNGCGRVNFYSPSGNALAISASSSALPFLALNSCQRALSC
jgi:hypothetical protein